MSTHPLAMKNAREKHLDCSEARRTCLTQTARLLGGSDQVAREFGALGVFDLNGVALHVIVPAQDDGPWMAIMALDRPATVNESAWSQSLLVANASAMMVDDWAFGFEDDGKTVLLMRLPRDLLDARLLAARLEGMLTMCRSVQAGAEALPALVSRMGARV